HLHPGATVGQRDVHARHPPLLVEDLWPVAHEPLHPEVLRACHVPDNPGNGVEIVAWAMAQLGLTQLTEEGVDGLRRGRRTQRLVAEQEELQCIHDVLSQTSRPHAPGNFDNSPASAAFGKPPVSLVPDPGAPQTYWITSSARRSREGGIVIPSALAVLRLMTSSNCVGCSTGRSAALVPLSRRST